MKRSPATSAAAVMLVIGGCSLQPVTSAPVARSEPASPAVREDPRTIVVSAANVPAGWTVYLTLAGVAALDASDTAPTDSPGFVDAALSSFDEDDEHEGDHEGRYSTFAAVFETVADAQRAFDAAVVDHQSPAGWGLSTSMVGLRDGYDPDPGLGDESVLYVRGSDYGFPELSVYLWRVDSVLLQVVDFHPYDHGPSFPHSIAEDMDARALAAAA